MGVQRNTHRRGSGAIAVLGAVALAVGCSSSSSGGSSGAAAGVPTSNLPVLHKIGKGEGQLNLIAWEGYLQPQWVNPFEKPTGGMINAKYAGRSEEHTSELQSPMYL